MKILVIGQCTLHWGRMEFGNMGNFYVIKPFFEEIHRVFPSAEILTTFQMSEEFCRHEKISCLPMELYYSWQDTDLPNAERELELAAGFAKNGKLEETTPYIDAVLNADLVIDYSGDIWGRNADSVGPNRFLVGLLKDRVAQLLGKPTAMLAGSPGPFNRDETLPLAQEVFRNFNLVTNREPISRFVLAEYGFDLSKCHDCACPAFAFSPASSGNFESIIDNTPLAGKRDGLVLGFALCGWNMAQGPFNRTDWADHEFSSFANAIREIVRKYRAHICFISHSNGFESVPKFKLIHGRDFPIVKQLFEILKKSDIRESLYLFDKIFSPDDTKTLIGKFDVLVSGRVHGAVAGLSQCVPTVIIDYGHEPKAHKLRGFASVVGMDDYVANPASSADLVNKISNCIDNSDLIRKKLHSRNTEIKKLINKNFDLLKSIIN